MPTSHTLQAGKLINSPYEEKTNPVLSGRSLKISILLFIYSKKIMTMASTYSVSTFGHIYQKALQAQLQKMGTTLSLLRRTRQEDINSVAAAKNIRPEILEKIENGQHDFRVKTLFALCDYYNVDLKAIVGQGELLNFKYE